MLGGGFPAGMPALSVLLADFLDPSPRWLAGVFGVSRSTAHRWLSADRAPRSVMLALYLAAPRYGQAEAANRVQHAEEGQRLQAALSAALRDKVTALERELARVVALGDFGAANAPSFEARTPTELLARPAALRPTAF